MNYYSITLYFDGETGPPKEFADMMLKKGWDYWYTRKYIITDSPVVFALYTVMQCPDKMSNAQAISMARFHFILCAGRGIDKFDYLSGRCKRIELPVK